jgi:hypothetical protein
VLDGFFIAGVIVGSLLTLLFVLQRVSSEQPNLTLGRGVTVFLSGYGVVAAIKFSFVIALDPSLPLSEADRVYMFIGGLAVLWVSVGTVVDRFRGN